MKIRAICLSLLIMIILAVPVNAANSDYVAIVDRIEGSYAVLEYHDETMANCKLSLLPKKLAEGDVLVIKNNKWEVDKKKTAKRKADIKKKMRNVFQNASC